MLATEDGMDPLYYIMFHHILFGCTVHGLKNGIKFALNVQESSQSYRPLFKYPLLETRL
jgi:hypothetical protein